MFWYSQNAPKLLSLERIWNKAPHCSMTDLIIFNEELFCVFRESDKHYKGLPGIIRVISSSDGIHWETCALLEEEEIDLRDPKFSITPNGQLLLLVEGVSYTKRGKYITRQPRVAFSPNGKEWSKLKTILYEHEWLWRLTWFNGIAYGISYSYSNPQKPNKEWNVKLFSTPNGKDYTLITQLDIPGYPNEGTIRFMDSGEMILLLRRDKPHQNYSWIGSSHSPYSEWRWTISPYYFGGPNFLILPNQSFWAAGRIISQTPYGLMEKTCIAKMSRYSLEPQLILPSGGDTGYPGMVYYDKILWVSYYSFHQESTSIYLAKVQLP